jgi:hypothetical protein
MIRSLNPLLAVRLIAAICAFDAVAQADDGVATRGGENEVVGREGRALTAFRMGRELMAQGRYEAACHEFAESEELDPAAGTMLNLGYCYEQIGKGFKAWTEYRAAATAAHDNGKSQWESDARARCVQLEASLHHVVVDVDETAYSDGVNFQLDGLPLPGDLRGKPLPVEAGRHELRATALGRAPWSHAFEIRAEQPGDVRIPVPEAEVAPASGHSGALVVGGESVNAAKPADTTTGVALPVHQGPQPGPDHASGRSALRTAALVTAGAGVGVLALAGGFGLWAKITYDGAQCPAPGHCTAEGIRANSRANVEANVGSFAAGMGATALVSAVILWSIAPARPTDLRVQPVASPSAVGFSVEKAW